MQIEAGKTYRNRQGRKVTIRTLDPSHGDWPMGYRFIDAAGKTYSPEGKFRLMGVDGSDLDLVEKVDASPSCTNARFAEETYARLGQEIFGKTLRDYTSAERKLAPVGTFLAEYFPDAIFALARLSKKANDKHNPGEPMHWARDKSSDHGDCAGRHMLTPDRIDPETGEKERTAALWRLMAAVQLDEEVRLVAAGIRPLSGVIPGGQTRPGR